MNAYRSDVDIILVSWNTRDLTLQCLDSLARSAGSYTLSVWVVDNASHDDSIENIKIHHPEVNIIENSENRGFAAANNQGIQVSSGRYVLLLNTDTIAHPEAIAKLIAFADTHKRAGMVGPMLLNPDKSYQGSFAPQPTIVSELLSATGLGVRLFGRWFPNYGPKQATRTQQAGYIQGACMLVRRETIEQVGLLDEHYFMYSEEPDWCKRMNQAGWEVWYTPDAQITHYGGQSTQQRRFEMLVILYRSKVRFFMKHRGQGYAVIFCALLLVVLRIKQLVSYLRQPGGNVRWISWKDLRPLAS